VVDIWSPAADPVTADSPRDAAPQCEFKTQCPHHDGARVQRLILRILEKRRHRCGRRHRLPGRSCRPVHHSGGRVVVERIHRIAHRAVDEILPRQADLGRDDVTVLTPDAGLLGDDAQLPASRAEVGRGRLRHGASDFRRRHERPVPGRAAAGFSTSSTRPVAGHVYVVKPRRCHTVASSPALQARSPHHGPEMRCTTSVAGYLPSGDREDGGRTVGAASRMASTAHCRPYPRRPPARHCRKLPSPAVPARPPTAGRGSALNPP